MDAARCQSHRLADREREGRQVRRVPVLEIGNPEANWAARNVAFAGSSSKERGLRFWLKRAKFNEWFGPDSKPAVRVVMEVVDSSDEEKEGEE